MGPYYGPLAALRCRKLGQRPTLRATAASYLYDQVVLAPPSRIGGDS